MKRISFDRNIVQFYGACLDIQPPMLIMEYMAVILSPCLICSTLRPNSAVTQWGILLLTLPGFEKATPHQNKNHAPLIRVLCSAATNQASDFRKVNGKHRVKGLRETRAGRRPVQRAAEQRARRQRRSTPAELVAARPRRRARRVARPALPAL